MKYIGFDIGGTKCAVCLGEEVEGSIKILKKEAFPQDLSLSPYQIIDKMCDIASSMTDDITSIGISCGGPLDSKNGIIKSPPNLLGWDDIKITDYVSKKMNCKVNLQNDANACAVAEWKYGAGRGYNNVIFLTFGTGMGAGLIIDGKLYSGTSDMAGEVGHIRLAPFGPIGFGKAGSFEGFCSGGGIAQLGRIKATEALQVGNAVSYCSSMSDLNKITAKTIGDCAKEGHADAIEVYNICGEKLGYALSLLIDILNPECIVLGSIFGRCEGLLRSAMERVINQESLGFARDVCKIVPAGLSENIGDVAALALATLV